jgi:hypothetical protein
MKNPEKAMGKETRFADPHPFTADENPDPSFHFYADPDPTFHFIASADSDLLLIKVMRICD